MLWRLLAFAGLLWIGCVVGCGSEKPEASQAEKAAESAKMEKEVSQGESAL